MHQINYKMTVQYEGTRYKGWQKQPRIDNTIQGKLETLLSRLLDADIEVFGAGCGRARVGTDRELLGR